MAEKDIDLKNIKELIEIMKQNGLEELEIQQGHNKVFLKRSTAGAFRAMPPMPFAMHPPFHPGQAYGAENTAAEQTPKADNTVQITSPIVGTFYAKPSPDADSFVEIGTKVEPKTVVCIIEAMKVMNEIKAEIDGTIIEVLVNNGQAVEYGQPLFKVRPD